MNNKPVSIKYTKAKQATYNLAINTIKTNHTTQTIRAMIHSPPEKMSEVPRLRSRSPSAGSVKTSPRPQVAKALVSQDESESNCGQITQSDTHTCNR